MSDNKATRVGERPIANQSAVLAWLLAITVNIALPITTFFLLSGPVGLPDVPALLISGIWPVLEIGYTVRTQRHVDEFSIFVLLGLVVGVVTTLFSGSAQAYFLKDSLATGLIGIAFLLSLLVGRPLTFYLGRRFATNGSKAQRTGGTGCGCTRTSGGYSDVWARPGGPRCSARGSSGRCSPGSWAPPAWCWSTTPSRTQSSRL